MHPAEPLDLITAVLAVCFDVVNDGSSLSVDATPFLGCSTEHTVTVEVVGLVGEQSREHKDDSSLFELQKTDVKVDAADERAVVLHTVSASIPLG